MLSVSVVNAAMGTNRDNSTYSNIDQVASTHIDLNFEVNFTAKHFTGFVIHDMLTIDDLTNDAWFDIDGTAIHGAYYRTDSTA